MNRYFCYLLTFASALLLSACIGGGTGPGGVEVVREQVPFQRSEQRDSGIRVKTLARGLRAPWGIGFLPDGSLLLTERAGALKLVDPGTGSVLEITGLPPVAAPGQGGLMDVLVHPDFSRNRLIYFSYTVEEDGNYSTRVSRARLQGTVLQALEELFTAQPFFAERRHFGSRLLLDGGYLYITVGDRGNRDLAQRLGTHNGKVIRLTEAGAVPRDNPFVAVPGARPEIWTFGHRNPQGIARHPRDGGIWVVEHGPQGGDEVNRLRPGANYGWPVITYGEEYGGGQIGEGQKKEGMEQPLVYWVPSIGTAGMAFYTGAAYPGWKDSLLVAGMRLTRISRLELEGSGLGRETHLLANLKLRIRDVRVGPDGLVYALADDSRLVRLEPAIGE